MYRIKFTFCHHNIFYFSACPSWTCSKKRLSFNSFFIIVRSSRGCWEEPHFLSWFFLLKTSLNDGMLDGETESFCLTCRLVSPFFFLVIFCGWRSPDFWSDCSIVSVASSSFWRLKYLTLSTFSIANYQWSSIFFLILRCRHYTNIMQNTYNVQSIVMGEGGVRGFKLP